MVTTARDVSSPELFAAFMHDAEEVLDPDGWSRLQADLISDAPR
jgi:hypothetical protein